MLNSAVAPCGVQTFGVKVQNGLAVGGLAFAVPDDVEKLHCDALRASAVRQVLDGNFIGQSDSFRGRFASTTIAKAGRAASLPGGGVA